MFANLLHDNLAISVQFCWDLVKGYLRRHPTGYVTNVLSFRTFKLYHEGSLRDIRM